jgi:hypothetical protein
MYIELTIGLYDKSFTSIIYDRIDSGHYYKSTITIIIYDHSLIQDRKLQLKVTIVTYAPNLSIIYNRKTLIVQASD